MPQMDLGKRVKTLRFAAELTLQRLSERSGVSLSALSKIENNQLSPTYDTLTKLAHGLSIGISKLFSDDGETLPRGRRSVTRRGEGKIYRTPNYDYEMLCTDLADKKIVPIFATIKAHERKDFSSLLTHDGEEVIFVVAGEIELITEFYEPLVLRRGDCVYFDSTMGHACIAHGREPAEVFWVCSTDVLGRVVGSPNLSGTNGAAKRPIKAASGRKRLRGARASSPHTTK
jgi:transcriptional regulator with XRE-family HTH domain